MITQEYLKSILHYCPDSGVFTWVKPNKFARNIKPGDEAGWIDSPKPYRKIRIDGKIYKAHHLAWFYIYGEWPKQLDHINQVKSDNMFCNLRIADSKQNALNRKIRSDNKTGYKGITWHKTRKYFVATISINKKRKEIGRYNNINDAIIARYEAVKNHYDLSFYSFN